MGLSPDTFRLADQLRRDLSRHLDAIDRDIARAWAAAWATISAEWEEAAEALADLAVDAGQWQARATVLRARKTVAALKATEDALRAVAAELGPLVYPRIEQVATLASEVTELIIRSQLPPAYWVDEPAWTHADQEQVRAIVDRTRGQIVSRARKLPASQLAVVRTELVRGVAVGDNPLTVARAIMTKTGKAFDGGRTRAETIARTEMLDANRAAARARRMSNPTVTGWVWLAALDSKTCPACASMHGTTHPVDEPGPADHPRGRCTAIPTTKPWANLGFDDINEPNLDIPDAEEWFWNLPRADQLAMMGPARLRMLEDGAIDWEDLAVRQENPDWRPSYVARPVRDLQQTADGQKAA